MKNARLNIRLDPVLLKRIRSVAERKGITVTQFITESIVTKLKKQTKWI